MADQAKHAALEAQRKLAELQQQLPQLAEATQKNVAAAAEGEIHVHRATTAFYLRLVLNAQFIPVASFIFIFALNTTLELFFHVVAPLFVLARHSSAATWAVVVLLLAVALNLWFLVRSTLYLTRDAWLANSFPHYRSNINRAGPWLFAVFASITGLIVALGTRGLIAPPAPAPGAATEYAAELQDLRAHHIVWILSCVGTVISGVCFKFGDRMIASLFHHHSSIEVSLATWEETVYTARAWVLLSAAFATAYEAVTVSPVAAIRVAVINLFGQVFVFSLLWVVMDIGLFIVSMLKELVTPSRLPMSAVFVGIAGYVASQAHSLHLFPGIAVGVMSFALTLGALYAAAFYYQVHYSYVRHAREQGTVQLLFRGVRTGAFIFLCICLMLLINALFAAAGKVDQDEFVKLKWEGEPVRDLPGTTLRMEHLGFTPDAPQSVTRLLFNGSLPSPAAAGTLGRRPAACHLQWAGMNLFDLALFAQLVHLPHGLPDEALLLTVLNHVTSGAGDWRIRKAYNNTQETNAMATAGRGVVFIDVYSPSRNLSIVSVQGTNPSNYFDVVQDLDMWAAALLAQLFTRLPTGLAFWPVDLLASAIEHSRFIATATDATLGIIPDRHYSRAVTGYVRDINDRQVLVVGHSLGGGISMIVGASTGRPAVSFSGPGMLMTRRKFGLARTAIYESVVNVVPEKDIVPMVDVQGGTIVHIPCRHDNPVVCHDLLLTASELYHQCGTTAHQVTGARYQGPEMTPVEFTPQHLR